MVIFIDKGFNEFYYISEAYGHRILKEDVITDIVC
jgi:hypothetical protein